MVVVKRLAVAFLAFNIMDLFLTLLILRLGGTEQNLIMRLVFEQPLPVAVGIKVGLGIVVALLLVWMAKRGYLWPLRTVTYAVIVICLLNSASLVVWL